MKYLLQQYLKVGKTVDETDLMFVNNYLTGFFSFAESFLKKNENLVAMKVDKGEHMHTPQEDTANGNSATLSIFNDTKTNDALSIKALGSSKDISSIGKLLSKRSTISQMRSMKIVPMQANAFTKDYNADVYLENEKVLQMSDVIQKYTDEEDAMIDAAKGLIRGMEMEGAAIPFKEFKTTFSTSKFLNGFYNSKMGGIYINSEFVIRGDHSRVAAARFTNYFINCINPAFGFRGFERGSSG
ncbi:hypothetical protein TrLO_g11255 [Triparma laevis f. longispina]|uniref:Uncharacterized protein n=1 Tax=Triparma laevis f. longispina TaxID=1714387 RepID=A0A9W7AIC0_9STRA|nr:hypothetical protein TrLO_g11255 [Triparma laevis f. longispina]